MKDSLKQLLKGRDTGEADGIDLELAASCEQYLSQRVEFRPASNRDTYLERLKDIYKPLNEAPGRKATPRKMQVESEPRVGPESNAVKQQTGENELAVDDVPRPRQTICSPDAIELNWKSSRGVGLGLRNVGNTCFLNSVLQCLTYTPPLVNYLNVGEHKKKCAISGFCAMCELQNHIGKVFGSSGTAVRPVQIVQNIKTIAKHFKFGRQEDAHEFLRYFVDALQRAALHQFPAKLDPYSKHTTVIHQIFGGYHRSQVKCLQCMKTSNTYDPLLDISLDIKGCTSLTKALQKSIKADMLDGDNKYACPFCKKMTKAHKRFTVHRLPKVLTIQLKRFEYNSLLGGKINKSVTYPEHLDVRPYMSFPQGESEWYRLYAVLVHLGLSCHSGHYFCYVKGANKVWYCLNDAQVQQVSLETALSQEAYLLFYIRDSAFKLPPPPPSLPVTGPLLPPPPTSSVASAPFAKKPREPSPAPPAAASATSSSTHAQPSAESSMGVPVQRPKKSDKPAPVHPPSSKPTGVVNPSPKVLPASEPHSPKVDLSMMAPPPPPPSTTAVKQQQPATTSSAEDSFELRKSALSVVPPKQAVSPIPPASAKPPTPLVRPTFMPRALKLGTKAPSGSKAVPSPALTLPGPSKLPPASSALKEGKSEKGDLGTASEPALSSEPSVSSPKTSVAGDLHSPRVARVQPQPHKISRPVARVPPSPQAAAARDVRTHSGEIAGGGGGKAHPDSAFPFPVSREGLLPHVGSSSLQWRGSSSELPVDPTSEHPLPPESDYSPGWVVTPVKKVAPPAGSSAAPDRTGGTPLPTKGIGTKIVFKKSQNWAPHKQRQKTLPGDSDLESDEEGPFAKPKKAVESSSKKLTDSGRLSKSKPSAPAEKDYPSHRRQDGDRRRHRQSRRRSSSTTSSTSTTSSSSSTDEEYHSRKRKRHRYRSSSPSSYSSESEEYRSSKRAKRDRHHRHHYRRSSEDGHHRKRYRHGHHHLSPRRRGYASDDSSSSGSILAQKKSRHSDHHRSRHWSESRRHGSESDRSRSPKRKKDKHHSHHHRYHHHHHHHHQQRKGTPPRKEHYDHHHHKRSSLGAPKKAATSGSRHETASKERDKHHHRDSSGKEGSHLQSKREMKWGDDGGPAHGDSKSSSGQAHKSASAGSSTLPAMLTKGSHASLGESVKTWSGAKNSIDASRLEGEGVFAGRDEWDKELDKGKLKKAKKHHDDEEWSRKNPFQEYHSKKNICFKEK